MGIEVVIVTKSERLPQLECDNFFHSTDLFRMVEQASGQKPYMVIAFDSGTPVAHMLVTLNRRGSLIPPYLFTQGRVYGEGEYAQGYDKEELFGVMLGKITKELFSKLCLYIEFSDISTKMFGYRRFRENGFFPVHWMEIHNSLHSMRPEDRLCGKIRKHLSGAMTSNIETRITNNRECLDGFVRILKNRASMKIRRYIPDKKLFMEILESGRGDLFTAWEKGKMTGGCICVYSGKNSYLWYLASKNKIHKKRTNAITVWTAIKHAYDNSYRHIYFMDVGLPFRKNKYREFILSFGGKPVGKYRWFRFSLKWINKILSWSYRD